MELAKIKLVVWDLDETFWSGTLSEGGMTPIDAHVELILRLTDCGVVNSICSKNDPVEVEATLRDLQLSELFVMSSVSWEPKGQRIRRIIKDMQLRAPNVLFLDDNRMNRDEALYYCPKLLVAGPELIPELIAYAANAQPVDPSHSRLNRYRILEEKVHEKAAFASNEEFLRDSAIHVLYGADCMAQLDRISELALRTNQLNFTKNRMRRDDLASLIEHPDTTSAYVAVNDRFGNYGIVGFYVVREQELVHFVFSCSILGMGVEQFTYAHIGRPALTVVGDVASSLDAAPVPDYITVDDGVAHQATSPALATRSDSTPGRRVLFKGPCDITSVVPYMGARDSFIDSEVNHPDERGVMITAQNHTAHIVASCSLSEETVAAIISTAPFLTPDAFRTQMFSGYDAVVLSTLPDSHEGLYRSRSDPSVTIAFSSYNFDLTDPSGWERFIDGTFVNHGFAFSRSGLAEFSSEFESIGPIEPVSIVSNLEFIRDRLGESTLLVLLLGSEIAPWVETQEFHGHAQRHAVVNRAVEGFAAGRPNVRTVNFTDFITGDGDFAAGINHFRRNKYPEIAEQISLVLNDYFDEDIAGTVRGGGSFFQRAVLRLRRVRTSV